MKISEIHQLLSCYSNERGQLQQLSSQGWFDQSDIKQIRRCFADDLGHYTDDRIDRELLPNEIIALQYIVKNANTEPDSLAMDIFEKLKFKLTPTLIKQSARYQKNKFKLLPNEVHYLIRGYLPHQGIISLSKVDRYLYHSTNHVIDQDAAKKILEKIANGIFNNTIKGALIKSPQLLYQKAVVTDSKGHAYVGANGRGVSVLQLAIAMGFTQVIKLVALVLNDEEFNLQYMEQLPNNWEEIDKEYILSKSEAGVLINLISNANIGDIHAALKHTDNASIPENQTVLREALDIFRERFTSSRKISIGTTLLRLKNILIAFQEYDRHYYAFCQTGSQGRKARRLLFCRQVIGYLLEDVSMCVQKIFETGLFCVQEKKRMPIFDGTLRSQREDYRYGFNDWFDISAGRQVKYAARRYHCALDGGEYLPRLTNLLNNFTQRVTREMIEEGLPMVQLHEERCVFF